MFIFVKKDGKNVGAFDREEIKSIHFNGKTLAIGLKDGKVSCFTLSQTDVDAVMDQMGNEQKCPKVAKEEAKNGFYFPKDSSSFEECEIIKITDDNTVLACYLAYTPLLNLPHKKYVTGTLGKDVFLNREEAEFHKLQLQNDDLFREISTLRAEIYDCKGRISTMEFEKLKKKHFWG